MSAQPELGPVQMREHHAKIPPLLQRPALDWLTISVADLPNRKQLRDLRNVTIPEKPENPHGRTYRHVAMAFARRYSPLFHEGHINDRSTIAETYREFLAMIDGLSQEDVLEGLIRMTDPRD